MKQQVLVLLLMLLFTFGDLITTELCLAAGGTELNPAMVNRVVRIGMNILITLVIWWIIYGFESPAGRYLLLLHLGIKGFLTVHNVAIWWRFVS